MNRRSMLKQTAAFAAMSAAAPLFAASDSRFQTLQVPVAQEVPGKIEVIEFFHYGCPHCRNFHPLLKDWKKSLPEDVAFRAIPAVWGNEQLRALARLYYAAERAEVLDRVEESIFAAIQDEKRPLFSESDVREWIATTGVDTETFMATYNSFSIEGLVQRADQIARTYRIQGVPTMAVGGRYITSATMTGSHAATLTVVDELIARVRKDA